MGGVHFEKCCEKGSTDTIPERFLHPPHYTRDDPIKNRGSQPCSAYLGRITFASPTRENEISACNADFGGGIINCSKLF